jgi:hypothetical protein
MHPLLSVAPLAILACAIVPKIDPSLDTQVWVRSHNGSDVDVYLLCGSNDARWLGSVPVEGTATLSIAPSERRCARGLNFFLVVRNQDRGYWVGPVRPQGDTYVDLVVEKYAAFSTARLKPDLR